MDLDFKILTKKIDERITFKLSTIGWALSCDLFFSNRIPEIQQNINLVNYLKNGDKIFISVSRYDLRINLNELVSILQKNNVKVYLYLMEEPVVPINIINLLRPISLGFYLQNNIYEDELIHCMPIGIRDCEKVVPVHKGFSHDYLYNEGNKTVTKDNMCLLCFSYTHEERKRCYNQLKNESFVKNLNDNSYEKQPSIHCGNVPVWINYEETHKSYYTLSPRGCGVDCHRFYEAIYLDSIPIVKRSNTVFDKMYNIFPCLIVNDWSDINEDLLLNNRDNCMEKIRIFKCKYPNFLTDLDSIHELLLQT